MNKISILQWNVWYLEDIHNIAKFLDHNKAAGILTTEVSDHLPILVGVDI